MADEEIGQNALHFGHQRGEFLGRDEWHIQLLGQRMADVQLGDNPQLHQHLTQHAAHLVLRIERAIQIAVIDLA